MHVANMSDTISRMVQIKKQIKVLSNEYDTLQADILKEAEDDLIDTKMKSVSYYSDSDDELTIALADTVSVVAPELLRTIFGEVYPSMVEEKTTYTLKSPAKRILSSIWHKEYCEGNVEDVINSLGCDEKTSKVLAKKLKGINFAKDKKNLMTIAGLPDEEASDAAYLINETMAWNNMCAFIKLNNNGEINQQILDDIILNVNAAVNVDRSIKATLKEACDGEE